MGRALAAASPAAAAVFAAADAALGEPISELAWDGPEEQLNLTENAQPALLATSIAYLAAPASARRLPAWRCSSPRFMAGHSMGQYSAMVAAGALSLADGVRLVRERGRQMQASGAGRDGAMAAILGLDDAAFPELVAPGIGPRRRSPWRTATRPARSSSPASGPRSMRPPRSRRRSARKRAIVLPVSVAAHSPLMAEAAAAMREILATVEFHDPARAAPRQRRRPGDHDGGRRPRRARRAPDRRRRLGPGRARRCRPQGVDTFIEVGPGKVLTNLIKRIAPDATAVALDDAGAPRTDLRPANPRPRLTPKEPIPCAAQTTPAASSSPASASSAPSATTRTPPGRTSSRAAPGSPS